MKIRKLLAGAIVAGVTVLGFAPAAFASATYGPSNYRGLDVTATITGSGTSTQLMGFHFKDASKLCLLPHYEIVGPKGVMMNATVRLCPGGASNPTLFGPYTPAGPYLWYVLLPGGGAAWEHSFTVR